MIDQPTKRNRYPLDGLAPAIALVLASVIAGCGTPLSLDLFSDKSASPSAEPSALPTKALAGDKSPYYPVVEYSARHGGRALVVVEGSEVVLAVGQNGDAIDQAYPLYNASQSFWGPLAIAAEIDGLLDLDERVSATIEEFADVELKKEMRVRHLLHFTSGLEAGFRPLLQEKPKNIYKRALTLVMVSQPGKSFQYGPSHLAVFGEVLRRKLAPESSDPLTYLQKRLLDPIGLTISGWERDADGNANLAGGAKLTAEEWATFGILIRDRGVWKGETVLEASSLEACFRGSEAEPRFGMTLWLNPPAPDRDGEEGTLEKQQASFHDELRDLVVARGINNQRLLTIPSLNLVVARMGKRDRSWRDRDFINLLVAARMQRLASVGK